MPPMAKALQKAEIVGSKFRQTLSVNSDDGDGGHSSPSRRGLRLLRPR